MESFTKRLYKIMEHYKLSATKFADEIGVQKSNISHILSGRNRPSLEFVLKIKSKYEEIQLDWLIYGIGDYPIQEPYYQQEKSSLFPSGRTENEKNDIEMIVVFYRDGSFKKYASNT